MIRFILNYRRISIVGIHVVLIVIANFLAFWLRFDGVIPQSESSLMLEMLPWLLLIRASTFIPFRLYGGVWRYTGIWDLRNIILGVIASTIAFYIAVHFGFGLTSYPRSVFVMDAILLIFLMGGIRLIWRLFHGMGGPKKGNRVLVYGAGRAGETIVRTMKSDGGYYDFEPIGFVDDNPTKTGQRIHGVPVLGIRQDLPVILSKAKPHEVWMAIPSMNAVTMREIMKALQPFKIPIKTLPSMKDIQNGNVGISQIRDLSLDDLFGPSTGWIKPRTSTKISERESGF